MSDTLVISGASGHFGQAVLRHLLDTLQIAPQRVVACSRVPDKLADWARRGVVTRFADFGDAASLAAAFAGAQRLLLISADAFDAPGARLSKHLQAVAAAQQSAVGHLVYTSMVHPEGSPIGFAQDHLGTEQALRDSTLPGWTVLRNGWYFENQLMGLPAVLASGHWYSAAADGRTAHIGRDDLALAAATVLAGPPPGRHVFNLTGREAQSHADIAAKVTARVGRPIQVIPVPVQGLVQGLVGAGLPLPLAQTIASFDENVALGYAAEVTDDFQRLTGRAPQSFDDWLKAQHAALQGMAEAARQGRPG